MKNDRLAFEGTKAARMLSSAMKRLQDQRGTTQREVAKELGYKSSVVLSHMASGRVPIPVDRARGLAAVLDIDVAAFLLAVLEQRHPDIDFSSVFGVSVSDDPSRIAAIQDIEGMAGCHIAEIPDEKIRLIREILETDRPRRRWLSVQALSAMELLRRHFPAVDESGVSVADQARIVGALTGSEC